MLDALIPLVSAYLLEVIVLDVVMKYTVCILSPQIPRQLYTTRSEKLVSEMVDFHHCIPQNEVRTTE